MDEKEKKKHLKQTMALLKIKIDNLKPHIEESERLNGLLNKMLIEKAVVKKELDDLNKSKTGLFTKIGELIKPKKKTLISDYFRS